MKMLRSLVLVLVTGAVSVVGAWKAKPLPSYISPCRRSDPDFSKCFVTSGRKAISRVLRGDPAYNLKPFLPYRLEKVDISPGMKLSLTLKNVDLYGLDTMDLINADIDLERRHFSIDLHTKLFVVLANYTVSGQILFLPVSGSGPTKLEFNDSDVNLSYDYDLVTRSDGKRYVANVRQHVSCNINKAHYQLDNLFNGNKLLGDNVNKILNDNYEEVLDQFGAVIREIIGLMSTELIRAYITAVPYDELFLP
ncbi:protein takeout-like [Euwallacea fornicatus]|uniref:protein takeout-like n=1 Tax=Euwallacea fornicatus TaxID=995702 RepID=UPI00338E5892